MDSGDKMKQLLGGEMIHQFGQRSGRGTYENVEWGGDAEVYGSPFIKDSKILGGRVFGEPYIWRSELHDNAIISGNCIVMESHINGNAIVTDEAQCIDSYLIANARLIDSAKISHTLMMDNAMVCGSGQVVGSWKSPAVLKDYDFIDRGVWYRRPKTYIADSGYVITENIGQLVTVSCTTNTIEKWLGGAGRRYGKIVGMTPEQIDEVQGYVEAIRDFKNALTSDKNALTSETVGYDLPETPK